MSIYDNIKRLQYQEKRLQAVKIHDIIKKNYTGE